MWIADYLFVVIACNSFVYCIFNGLFIVWIGRNVLKPLWPQLDSDLAVAVTVYSYKYILLQDYWHIVDVKKKRKLNNSVRNYIFYMNSLPKNCTCIRQLESHRNVEIIREYFTTRARFHPWTTSENCNAKSLNTELAVHSSLDGILVFKFYRPITKRIFSQKFFCTNKTLRFQKTLSLKLYVGILLP